MNTKFSREWSRLCDLSGTAPGWQEIDRLYLGAGGIWLADGQQSCGSMCGLALDVQTGRYRATGFSPKHHSTAREELVAELDGEGLGSAAKIEDFRAARVAGWHAPWACRFGSAVTATPALVDRARDLMLEKRIALPLFWLLTQRIDPKLHEFKLKRRIAVAA